MTNLVGILAFFCITDFPREARWLSEEEKQFVLHKTGQNEPHTVPVTTTDVLTFLSKPKHWVAAVMYFTVLVPAYSIVYFLPTIVQTLGYGTIQTQLHSVPPFAATPGFVVVISYLSDKWRVRSPSIFLGLALLVTGLAILTPVHGAAHFSAEYAAICLAMAALCAASSACYLFLTWREGRAGAGGSESEGEEGQHELYLQYEVLTSEGFSRVAPSGFV